MTAAPERIWLQDAGDFDGAYAVADVTWAVEPIDDRDTEYVRADTIAALRARLAEVEAERDKLRMRAANMERMLQAAEAALATARADALREAAGYITRAIDCVTSGAFDQSDPRIAALCEYADAILALIDKDAAG